MFVDDTLLFYRENDYNVETTVKCFYLYCLWSNRAKALRKSSLFISKNTSPILIQKLEQILLMSLMDKNTSQLGNPLFFFRARCEELGFLEQKVLKRIEGWNYKFLSRAWRTILIQTVVSLVPLYSTSTFDIPSKLCCQLDIAICNFQWKGNGNGFRYLAMKSWDSICQSKAMGGPDIQKFKEFWPIKIGLESCFR